MRKLVLAVLPTVACLLGVQARAAPLVQPGAASGSNIVLADGGCGADFYRGANHACYRKRGHYGPPPGYNHREPCPHLYHMTPGGCRRDY